MSKKIGSHTSPKVKTRASRKQRFRKKLETIRNERPRLVVFRSNKYLYAQVIDDKQGITLVQANSREKTTSIKGKNVEAAKAVGKTIAERLKEKQVEAVVFDRNGYGYHGRIKALAEGAREAGLKF
ncbi:MAG: 50S ribosomal protein L18 [Bdellovibrionales bacterium]|nr:50S ribosomal protein L18 [Bdellovibrionales bacterium]MCB0417787.1 50S ribosomal protein L18 [Bdellovibrionales bacterium]MCB9253955.1 50S ribosomal protein L18 [Pseudobdellovibrionaceae bacterium]